MIEFECNKKLESLKFNDCFRQVHFARSLMLYLRPHLSFPKLFLKNCIIIILKRWSYKTYRNRRFEKEWTYDSSDFAKKNNRSRNDRIADLPEFLFGEFVPIAISFSLLGM